MKVYVCESESYDNGREVVAVFTTLDAAQEKMRIEYDGYRDTHKESWVEWLSGDVCGHWGWYDVCVGNGFYVTEIELNKWHK